MTVLQIVLIASLVILFGSFVTLLWVITPTVNLDRLKRLLEGRK